MSERVVKALHRSPNGRRLYAALLKNQITASSLKSSIVANGYIPDTSELDFRSREVSYRMTVFHIQMRDHPAYQLQDRAEVYEWHEFNDPEVIVAELARLLTSGPDRTWIRQ